MNMRRDRRDVSRKTRRSPFKTGLVALAAIVPVFSVLAVTSPASAHANVVSGVAACQTDGTYTVNWTVANDYTTSETSVTFVASTGGGTIAGLPTSIAPSPAKATVTQTGIPGTAIAASLTVKGVWADNHFTTNNSGDVTLAGTCLLTHIATAPTFTQPTCLMLTGTIGIPVDADVTYKVDGVTKSGTVTGVPLGSHTVTASSSASTLTGTTSWPVTFVATTAGCRTKVDIPVPPTPTEPTCDTGSKLNLPLTSELPYTWSDEKQPTDVGIHTLIATTKQGHVFTDGQTTHTFHVTVAGPLDNCPAPLIAPTITQPTCEVGQGSFTLPTNSSAVTYSKNGNTVTATTAAPYKFAATSGWVIAQDGRTATYQVRYTALDNCAAAVTAVTPVAPVATQSTQCDSEGTYTIPNTVGVVYLANGKATTAGTYTGPITDAKVTAQAQPGYALSTDAWSSTLTVAAAASCTIPEKGGQLAQTGSTVAQLTSLGATAFLVGLLLLTLGTRRRQSGRRA